MFKLIKRFIKYWNCELEVTFYLESSEAQVRDKFHIENEVKRIRRKHGFV